MGDLTRTGTQWAETRRVAALLTTSNTLDSSWALAPLLTAVAASLAVGVPVSVVTPLRSAWLLGLLAGVLSGAVRSWRRLDRWSAEVARRNGAGEEAVAAMSASDIEALCCVFAGGDYAEPGTERLDAINFLAALGSSFSSSPRSAPENVWWHSYLSYEPPRRAEELWELSRRMRRDPLAAELFEREVGLERKTATSARHALAAAAQLRAAAAVDVARALLADSDAELADIVDAACTVART